MKTDTYTKIILTLIAVALVAIATKDTPSIIPQAQAQTQDQLRQEMHNQFDPATATPAASVAPATIDVNIVSVAGIPIKQDGLHADYKAIPVDIQRVDGSSTTTGVPVSKGAAW